MTYRPSVLVTGGAGYIGSHCCSKLHSSGFEPICFDNLSTGHQQFVNWGPLIVGDIRDTHQLRSVMRDHDVQAVMHFAACSSVGESVANPGKYYSNNVVGTLSLLEAMIAIDCNKLVYSSTAAVYGEGSGRIISECDACEPVSPYGRTKLVVEQMVADFIATSDLRAISLRYFNACGAEASGLIGEMRQPETHLIPRAFMTMLGQISEFNIFGSDYSTPDGTAIRDYIHVEDLAQAHLLALNALLDGRREGTFNLGTGIGISVKEILAAIGDVTGGQVYAVTKARRIGDPATLVANPSSARTELGFKAEKSEIKDIISSAWTWHQKAHRKIEMI